MPASTSDRVPSPPITTSASPASAPSSRAIVTACFWLSVVLNVMWMLAASNTGWTLDQARLPVKRMNAGTSRLQ